VAPPENFEKIAARVFEVDRLAEGAFFGVVQRTLETDVPTLELVDDFTEAATRDAKGVAKTVRPAVLIWWGHRHEFPRDHQRQQIVLQNYRSVNGTPSDSVVGLEINAVSRTRAQDVAVKIFRLPEIVNADGAVAETLDI